MEPTYVVRNLIDGDVRYFALERNDQARFTGRGWRWDDQEWVDLGNATDVIHRFWQDPDFEETTTPPARLESSRDPNVVARAQRIAETAHAGQVDKSGHPYINHPRRVAERLHGDAAVAAGWLHDVLEDTPTTTDDLRAAGIPEEVIDAVVAVTKRPGESAEDYAARVRESPIGYQVKLADLDDNTDPERLTLLDDVTRSRLETKYDTMRSLVTAA